MVVVKSAGIFSDSPLGTVLSSRAEILELTEKSHDAALRPRQPGGLTHSERTGLACRISKFNDEVILVPHHGSLIGMFIPSREAYCYEHWWSLLL